MGLGGGIALPGQALQETLALQQGMATLHPFLVTPSQGVPDRAHRIAVQNLGRGGEVRVKGCNQPPIPEPPLTGSGGEGSNGGGIR